MDKKKLLTALLFASAAFLLTDLLIRAYSPSPKPAEPPQSSPPSQPVTAERPLSESPGGVPVATTQGATTASADGVSPTGIFVAGADQRQTLTIGSVAGAENSPYRMAIELDNRGASVRALQLSDYGATVGQPERYALLQPVNAEEPALLSLATEKVFIGDPQGKGTEANLDNVLWHCETRPVEHGVEGVFWVDVMRDQTPLVRISKTVSLTEQPLEALRHDLRMQVSLQNLTDAPMDVVLTQRGPIGVKQEDARSDDHRIYAGVNAGGEINVAKVLRGAVVGKSPPALGSGSGEEPLAWASVSNKYFTFIVAPLGEDGQSPAPWVAEVRPAVLTSSSTETSDLTFRLVTSSLSLPPNGGRELAFSCYAGPLSKDAFDKVPEYAARNYYGQVEQEFAWCTFGWLVKLMIWLLNALGRLLHNFGLAIIVLVLIVRTILHPITKKGQVNMMKMQKQMASMQPKIAEAKAKYPNDKAKQQQEIMRVYGEAGINPMNNVFTCLPMFLQMPIWVALWGSLNNNILMRHEGFVLWIKDLTAPDALIHFANPINIPLLSFMIGPVHSFNLIPILLAVTMYFQQRFMRAKTAKTQVVGKTQKELDQMEQQQKMMSFMSVFLGIILYNAPSGLTLYIMTSNVFGMVEQWRIREHLKTHEEELATAPKKEAPEKRKPSFLERIQKAAEDAQKVKSNRSK